MSTIRNSVHLIGRLGFDPKIQTFENGQKMTKIALATSYSYKNKAGEKIKVTDWHNLILWGNQALLAVKMLKKGAEIAVEGKISNRPYRDKMGESRYYTEIILKNFILISNTTA